MIKVKVIFCFDGTHFNGWQRQKNTPNTVQEILENKLSMIANFRVKLLASGRTDAGVHARVQVAHGKVPDEFFSRPNRKKALNSLLPPDIRVIEIMRAPDDFHAIADVDRKTYLYFINPNPVQWPWLRDYCWHLRLPLDWDAVQASSRALVGTHDFKGLCAANFTAKSSVRTIHEAYWDTMLWAGQGINTRLWVFRVTGSGFLKQMVRTIVGTAIYIGNGRAGPDLIQKCIESGDRRLAGPTAPARGLWLWDIAYST